MAELGHPIIGPQSYWKLTPAEIRVYAEGLKYKNDRQAEATHGGTSGGASPGPSYNRQSKKRRDEAALRKAEQKAQKAHQ